MAPKTVKYNATCDIRKCFQTKLNFERILQHCTQHDISNAVDYVNTAVTSMQPALIFEGSGVGIEQFKKKLPVQQNRPEKKKKTPSKGSHGQP